MLYLMHGVILVSIAGIGLLSLACQWLAWWVRLPAILFLLVAGVILGSELGWLNPDALFGSLLIPFIQLAVAIILFEGSLTLNFDEIRGQGGVVRNLISIGLLVTAVLTALFSHWILDLNWQVATLFGAIISVTGPTVIVPMLRSVRPDAKISNILRWEGILIDPIGALLAVVVFNIIASIHGNTEMSHIIRQFFEMTIVASVLGIVSGYWLGLALCRHWLPEFLHNIATLTVVIALYVIANRIDDGSGLLAVTIMGIWMANMKEVHVDDILGFKESLSILLISGLFIILAARIQFDHLHEVLLPTIYLLLILQFVVRPINVFISAAKSDLNWREKILLSWVCPRGIVAAAVAALFAIRLKHLGFADAPILILLTFLIIVGTVVLQSITSRGLARLLKVAEPEPKGLLIIGANPVSIEIAKAIQNAQYRVLLASQHREGILKAKLQGLKTYYGNPVSAHADRHLDLVGIGGLLALTGQRDLNALACMRYRSEFGRQHVFSIETEQSDRQVMANKHQARILFGEKISYRELQTLLSQGAQIKTTTLTKNFDYHSFQLQNQDKAIPLFALDPKNNLHIFTDKADFAPAEGWSIISLLP